MCIASLRSDSSPNSVYLSSNPSSKSGVAREDVSDPDPTLVSLSFCELEILLNRSDELVMLSLQESSGRACPAATRPTKIVGTMP